MSSLDWLNINDLQLKQSIVELVKAYPSSSPVIQRLVQYYEKINGSDRDVKRRKIEQEENMLNNEIFRVVDLSFQLPARKKYDLIITQSNDKTRHLLLYNNKTNTAEFQFPIKKFSHLGGTCVPTPDKAVKTFTYTLFLNATDEQQRDCLVFTTQEKTDVVVKKVDEEQQVLTSDQKHEIISELLAEYTGVPIAQPSKDYFRSTGSDNNKPGENRAHVMAYHKAKDGFLFFLPTGILFGFKKPTIFVPVSSLASTVIMSVTNRTFDFMLKIRPEAVLLGSSGFKATKEGDEETIQFSMIEQAEYEGIEAYTKKLNINDHSLAEERKATVSKKQQQKDEDVEMSEKNDTKDKGKGRAVGSQHDDDDSDEFDDDFEPSSDDDHDPLEYDTDADEEEADKELAAEEEHEFQDAVFQDQDDDDEEEQLLDESD